MSKLDLPLGWNLVLIAASTDGPERVLRFLSGAVSACGGWVTSRESSGEQCAEMEFEFPRANCVEIYSVLVATGLTLSQRAHKQLTELCQCTSYLLESKAYDIARMHLTIYTHSSGVPEVDESGAVDEGKTEAA